MDATKKRSASLAWVPPHADHAELVRAVQACRGCDLYARATQAVFGEGATSASLLLVGEQPGDQEDRQGRPFVGPAGRVLDEALEAAGIPRREVYLTNAVKHFKWEPRGKRRLHTRPSTVEVLACRGWLEAELGLVDPEVVVCLGATAAQAILGGSFRVTKDRGRLRTATFGEANELSLRVLATWHPSAILRADDASGARARMRDELTADLATAWAAARGGGAARGHGRGHRARAGAP